MSRRDCASSTGVYGSSTHAALRREAPYRGRATLFTSATALVTALTKAHHDARLEERLAHFAKPKLLILDELGHLPLETNAAAHVIPTHLASLRARRDARNYQRPVSGWRAVFGDSAVAAAILDRLLHHRAMRS
jgi:DNA replication protein DnaC